MQGLERPDLVYEDESEAWLRDIMDNHYEEARRRAFLLLEATVRDENGCMVTATQEPRKIRFRGRQIHAYRFIYCVLNRRAAARQEVVRHRCHNRLCVNPEHLESGSQADNKHDDWARWAYGIDARFL